MRKNGKQLKSEQKVVKTLTNEKTASDLYVSRKIHAIEATRPISFAIK